MHFTRHIVAEMDASMVQKCVLCGEIISDYRNTEPVDQPPPKGFPAGEVYVSGYKRKIYQTSRPTNVTINECKQRPLK